MIIYIKWENLWYMNYILIQPLTFLESWLQGSWLLTDKAKVQMEMVLLLLFYFTRYRCFVYMRICGAPHRYYTCTWCTRRPGKGIRSSGTGVVDGCRPPCGAEKLIQSLCESSKLTAEPSLQSLEFCILKHFLKLQFLTMYLNACAPEDNFVEFSLHPH